MLNDMQKKTIQWGFLTGLLLMILSCTPEPQVYLYTYFKGRSHDGMHLAYSYDGYQWKPLMNDSSFLKPQVATDKLMRDPCIIKGGDGLYHMVWTVSWNDKGIGYANSADLLHWSKQQFIPLMAEEDSAVNCWAPEVFYDELNKDYMIYWATTIKGQFMETASTLENGYNHRMYYVRTKDFKSFTKAQLLYDQGFNVIDATIQKLDTAYVMFLKDETREPVEKNLRLAFSQELDKGYGKPSEPITGNYWAEGPTAIKIGAHWMVYFDKYREHTLGAVRSKDLIHWEDISDQVELPKGLRHGTVFSISMSEFKHLQKQIAELK